jgi:hypothetical protein
MMVFYSKGIVIRFISAKCILKQEWVGFISSDDFKGAIDFTLQFVLTNKVDYLISDTRLQKPISQDDVRYAASIMPPMFAKGLKAMAFILPENVITKLELSSFAKEQGTTENVKYFTSLEEAEAWLLHLV